MRTSSVNTSQIVSAIASVRGTPPPTYYIHPRHPGRLLTIVREARGAVLCNIVPGDTYRPGWNGEQIWLPRAELEYAALSMTDPQGSFL